VSRRIELQRVSEFLTTVYYTSAREGGRGGCKNRGRQVASSDEILQVAPNICGSSGYGACGMSPSRCLVFGGGF
jgi:hypothetical protein